MFSMDNKMSVSSCFTCETCNAVFICLKFFQLHRKEHAQANGVTLLTCAHCHYSTDDKFSFNWHAMTHTKGQEHKCNICAPNEVSKNTWSNPSWGNIDSDSISSIDCSRFGKRSIATQYDEEDVDEDAEPYPLTGELDYDEETEEELEEGEDEQETEEDDASTQIEDEQESEFLHNNNHHNGYESEEEEYVVEDFQISNQDEEDYSQITEDGFHHQEAEIHQEEIINEVNDHNNELINHHSDNNIAQQSHNEVVEVSKKRKSSRRRSKRKVKDETVSNDIYDFKSDDDAHFESNSLSTATRTPSRSSSISHQSQIHPNNGQQLLAPNGTTDHRGMMIMGSHSGQVNQNDMISNNAVANQQSVPNSQNGSQPNTHLLQPAANQGAFIHPNMHPHMHSGQDGQNGSNGHSIQAFQMPQQFFTLPQPGPFGGVPGPQQHPQFIPNPAQFQPGGQIQLVSIPANMQQQNTQFLQPPQAPSQHGQSHSIPTSQQQQAQPQQQQQPTHSHQSQSSQEQQSQNGDTSSNPETSKPAVVKAKKSKYKHAVLLPSPGSNNRQSRSKKESSEDSPSAISPIKPKGHGKGNRKPRINFVSLGNGITIGSDGIRRKFHCSLCGNGKSFKTKSHLQRHMLTHTGEKPYQCHDCGSKFNQSSSLRNHMIAIHTKQFPHSCQVCGKGFLMPAVLQRHIQQSGHIADEESCQENSNGSNAISTNENISNFNNVMAPIRPDGYYPQTFNNPSNVMMTYTYAPT